MFLYQAVGLAAAVIVYIVWATADPAGSILARQAPADFIVWWGLAFDARAFLLLSLAVFAAWTLTGCVRQMRLELKMRNGPYVWLGFLRFIGVYVAGFDAWLSGWQSLMHLDAVARRLLLAGTTYGALAYLMVFLEPKDRVHYRWLGGAFAKFQFGPALGGLQGWMTATLAALGVGIALLVWLGQTSRRTRRRSARCSGFSAATWRSWCWRTCCRAAAAAISPRSPCCSCFTSCFRPSSEA